MKLIVIEGLDGSGKATQTAILAQQLQKRGIPVKTVSFPDYEKPWSCLVRMYLDGEFGSRPEDVSAYAASSFFAMDRFASYRTGWQKDYEAGTVILCDRYVGSNAIHQSVKLPREEWSGFLDWLFDFEYKKLGLPQPSATVYLKMHPNTSKTCCLSVMAETRKKEISMKKISNICFAAMKLRVMWQINAAGV